MSHTLGPLDTDMQLFNELEERLHAKDDIIADLLEALEKADPVYDLGDPSNLEPVAYSMPASKRDDLIRKARGE